MHKKVVLMVIPNLNFGGAQRVFYNLSLDLSAHYEIIECVFNFDAGHAFHSGNKVVSLEVKGGKTVFGKLWQFFLRCKRLRDIKKSINPAICISHLEGADLVNVLSQTTEQTITWVHGSKLHDQNISGFLGFIRHQLLIPFTYKRADKVITVSKAIKEELVTHYGIRENKIETIHNYFDVPLIVTKSNTSLPTPYLPIFDDCPTLIFSGRLAVQKNPESMLRWFASFRSKYPCKLIIVGDGELRQSLIELSGVLKLKTYTIWSELGLKKDHEVYFLGFQENPFQFIHHSTAFILPSLWEGFPMVLGEAMACSVPVISADCPTGPKEMLTDSMSSKIEYPYFAEYGLLLPLLAEDTYSIWTKGVSEMIENKSYLEQYSRRAIERAQNYSRDNNSKHIQELIESFLPG